jgi:hypothetical protein
MMRRDVGYDLPIAYTVAGAVLVAATAGASR